MKIMEIYLLMLNNLNNVITTYDLSELTKYYV